MAEKEILQENVKRIEASFNRIMKKLGPQMANLEEGLTQPQFYILGLLQNHPRTVTEIAGFMKVQPSAVTAILDRMHNNGFILRERNETDRRVVVVRASEKGETVYHKSLQKRLNIMMHYLSRLEQRDLQQLLEIYEKMARIVEKTDPPQK